MPEDPERLVITPRVIVLATFFVVFWSGAIAAFLKFMNIL